MRYLFYDFVKITAGLPGLVAFRPKLLYRGKKERIRGGALIIANHFGFFDPIYLQYAVWYRRMRFVCLQSFFDSRAGWLFGAVHCIPINRDNIGMDSIRTIIDSLKEDKLVALFPEGHVNEQEGIDPFKSGMVLMAMQSDKPIIPVYIRPRKHWYERLVLAIGEGVNVKEACDNKTGMAAMEEVAAILKEKEEELKILAEGWKR